jgi:hypothetical protein
VQVVVKFGVAAVVCLAGTFSQVGSGATHPKPIVVEQGRLNTFSPAFSVGRQVVCVTFGRRLTVHVPRRGETTAQFRTDNGTHVFFYLTHFQSGDTHIMCGAAKWFGGH